MREVIAVLAGQLYITSDDAQAGQPDCPRQHVQFSLPMHENGEGEGEG
jgi:hypothetical protein